MKIDRRRFIEIKSDKKVDRQIITINENGVIEISREMQDVNPISLLSSLSATM